MLMHSVEWSLGVFLKLTNVELELVDVKVMKI